MNEVKLNLARKWRSKQFDEIIGQDLSIRMLKNSLYLQQYFPVYLFSGQRGCGKTTTARVFAASLNCECLPLFQKSPQKQAIPCLNCDSCKAMELGKHPDFIEIDAASHTGVDNIRMLIDSASLLPLMGRKKIYLIDEAHMLSKAAFNALLKILEEPPTSVIFILATTDPQKIIETVHSRCFQLFFRSVDMEVLHARLRDVCLQENISFDQEGLSLIIKQTDGSVRDALNLLEQVRFSSKEVTQKAVLDVLGFIDDAALLALFERVLSAYQKDVLQFISDLGWHHYSAHLIWVRLLELIRAALWIKHDVAPALFTEHHAQLKLMVSKCTVQQLIDFLQIMYDQELLFTKTTAKHDFIEMVLLQMCQRVNQSNSDSGTSSSSSQAPIVAGGDEIKGDFETEDEEIDEDNEEDGEDEETLTIRWKQFVTKVAALNDPLIHSIFTQGTIKQWDEEHKKVHVEFSKELGFFSDLLEQTKSDWQPLLSEVFEANITLVPLFTGASRTIIKKTITGASQQPMVHSETKPRMLTKTQQTSAPYQKSANTKNNKSGSRLFATDKVIDISDTKVWHKTHLILHYLPGTVTEIRE
jgi:DNA polymerase-3 subunit gamma/tau